MNKINKTLLLALAAAFLFIGCGEDEEPDPDPDPDPVGVMGLPASINGFETWLKMNAETIPLKEEVPHKGTKEVYVNQTRETLAPNGEQVFPYPDGTIIVKAGTGEGLDFLSFVAIMTKKAGAVEEANDWIFVKYARESADADFMKVGEGPPGGEGCIGCHMAAAETDYSFTVLE